MSPEKENTIRALRNEPLIMTSVWCIFGIHKWTKYSNPESIGTKYFPGKRPSGYYKVINQEAFCVHCNKLKLIYSYQFSRDS